VKRKAVGEAVRVSVKEDIFRYVYRVSVDVPYEVFVHCRDRREFRVKISELLGWVGDQLMQSWDDREAQEQQ
jgi:hypothetical protein